MAINFVAKSEESARIAKIRRLVKSVTTIVLVGYIVVVAGLVGWWGYISNREKKVSIEMESLTVKVATKSEVEVAMKKLADRTKIVSEFLDGRVEVAADVGVLSGSELVVSEWTYEAGSGGQSTVVGPSEVEKIENFVNYLEDSYNNVSLENISWRNGIGWTGKVNFSGHRKVTPDE